MNPSYCVLSVQVGVSKPIPIQGKRIMSAIEKKTVSGRIKVNPLGLEGDEQADPSVHGGLSKAVYAYPSEHYGYWRDQIEIPDLPHGSLGENLTISGLLEKDLFVGDELHFRDCVLRVTQPRHPCYKFNAVMHDKLAAKKMAQTGFCGFYLSVKSAGSIMAGEEFELIPGERSTSIMSLFKVTKAKTRND